MRNKPLLILWRRHAYWPEAHGLNGETAAVRVVYCHKFREVQSFVKKWAENGKAGVVETSSKLRGHKVELVFVRSSGKILIGR